jgi:phosphate transport system substrate-binding protein
MRLRSRTLAMSVVTGLLTLPIFVGCNEDRVTIQGSGATFPAPVYKRWFLEYYLKHPNVRISYQAIGSGAGIRQFTSGIVKFGATDDFMKKAEIDKAKEKGRDPIQLPMTAGSIVLAYNPALPADLKLTRETYVGIFRGRITSWDDDEIRASNPGVNLPKKKITVISRQDSSGTTFNFTNHLAACSDKWDDEKKWGEKPTKDFPYPIGIKGKGNAGVASLIEQTPGGIGYLEYSYADLAHLPMAHLQNHHAHKHQTNRFIKPSPESGKAALEITADKIPENLHIEVKDPEGEYAYPIVTYTWLICDRHYDDPRIATELYNVIMFGLNEGQEISVKLGYLALPEEVVKKVQEKAKEILPK